MTVNLPKDPMPPSNTPSQSSSTAQSQKNEPEFERYSPNRDSVETAAIRASHSPAQSTLNLPGLSAPDPSDISIIGAFRSWIDAAREFRHQLRASDSANLEVRRKINALSVDQTLEFSKMLAEKEAAIARLEKDIQNELSGLDQQFQEMQSLTEQQRKEIDQLNSGNAQEKKAYADLNNAYDRYIADLDKIGVVQQGNGNYLIPDAPPEVLEQYNRLTQTYQQAVNSFNSYWARRSQQIESYNKNTLNYNQKVAEYNKGVNEFISENDLAEYLKSQKINLPQMTQASRRDISGYQDQMGAPSQIKIPSSISISPLPSYVKTIAEAGATPLSKPVNLPSFTSQTLYSELYNKKYEEQITPFDSAALQYVNYHSFINQQHIHHLDDDLSFDDLMNMKHIQKLISFKPTISLSSSANLMIKTFGLEDTNLQSILGTVLLKEALNQSQLSALSEVDPIERQAKIEEMCDKIILLSLGLLGNHSLQALFPSLGIISDILPALPKNDPTFAIVFAVSLCNRVAEGIAHGISSTALETFLNASPEFAGLSPSAKKQLEASLNIGQLLVSAKLLEESLGLPRLLAHLFPSLSPLFNPGLMMSQATQADRQSGDNLQLQIQNHFTGKGYPEEKARFFAEVGTESIQYGMMTPAIKTHIQESTIDYSLLKHSIKAEIALLPGKSLQEADHIADEALLHTFKHQPFSSTKQFHSTLQEQLADLNVPNSAEMALSAILVPRLDPSIAQLRQTFIEKNPTPIKIDREIKKGDIDAPLQAEARIEPQLIEAESSATMPQPLPLSSNAPQTSSPLPSSQLIAIVEKQTQELLAPQLGAQLAKELGEEILTTLFGKPHTPSQDAADIQSPYALVNIIKTQLYHLRIQQDQKWAEAVHETFTDSLKSVTSFYEFSKKLQSPAYQYIRAFSIINGHQNQSWKNGIDIPI